MANARQKDFGTYYVAKWQQDNKDVYFDDHPCRAYELQGDENIEACVRTNYAEKYNTWEYDAKSTGDGYCTISNVAYYRGLYEGYRGYECKDFEDHTYFTRDYGWKFPGIKESQKYNYIKGCVKEETDVGKCQQ